MLPHSHVLSSPWTTRGGCEAHLHFTDEESEGPSGDGLAGEQRRDVGPGLPDAGL